MGRRLQLLRIIPTSALAASNLKSVCLHGNFLERSSGGRSLERRFFSPEDLEKDFCPALLHSVLVCSISCDHRGLNLRGSAAALVTCQVIVDVTAGAGRTGQGPPVFVGSPESSSGTEATRLSRRRRTFFRTCSNYRMSPVRTLPV